MSIVYNAGEIFDMGIQIEKNGRAFYTHAASQAEDPEIAQFFRELANWEESHIALFESFKKDLPAQTDTDALFDPDGDAHRYIKAAADSHVFLVNDDMQVLARECENVIDALRMALRFEKDSVVLYSTLKNSVSENLGKEKIDKLIQEELVHVSLLQEKIGVLS